MKSFVCACIILAVVLALTAANAVALGRGLGRLGELCGELSDSVDDTEPDNIDEIQKEWAKNRTLLGLSIDAELVRETDELLLSLQSAKQTGDKEGFARTIKLLCEHIDELRELESFSLSQIF